MSLTSLIIANGSTLEETVAALGISGYLIERIEAGRQPLPFELAEQLAAHLGVEVGDVVAEVDRVSTTGARAGFNAVPADLVRGDRLPPVLLHPLEEVVLPERPEVEGEWVWITSNGSPSMSFTDDYLYVVDVVNENLVAAIDLTPLWWFGIIRASGLAYDATNGRVICLGHDQYEGWMITRFDAATATFVDLSFGGDYGDQWGCDWNATEGLWKDSYFSGWISGVVQLDETSPPSMPVVGGWPFTDSPAAEGISLNLYENGFAYAMAWDPTLAVLTWRRVKLSDGSNVTGATNLFPAGVGGTTQPVIDSMDIGDGSDEVYGVTVARIDDALYVAQAGNPFFPFPPPIPIYATDMNTLATTPVFPVGPVLPGYWMGGSVADDDGNLWITTCRIDLETSEWITFFLHKVDPSTGNVLAWYRMPNGVGPGVTEYTAHLGIAILAAGAIWAVARVEDWMSETTELRLVKFDLDTADLLSWVVLHEAVFNPRAGFDIIATDVGPTTPVPPPGGRPPKPPVK